MDFLELNIVRRKRLDRSGIIYGFIAAVLLIGALFQYVKLGKVPLLEELARQLGILNFLGTLQAAFFIVFGIVLLRGLYALFKNRNSLGGALKIDPGKMQIQKGKLNFELTGVELQQLKFELKAPHPDQPPLTGGNWVKIPSPHGTYRCEFDLCDQSSFDALKGYIDHYKTEHNVQIDIEESTSPQRKSGRKE